MTDEHAGYIVTLNTDIREDDAESILTALRMVRGVLSVEPVVANLDLHMAEDRARYGFRSRLIEFIKSLDAPTKR